LDLHGTNCVIDAACASSLGALNLALLELGSGRCDMALSGGLDTFNDIFMYMCFSKTPALSPTGDARPFDAGCDGTILGEGLGVVALKRLDDARRDGDKIYAVIRSVGTSSDGKGNAVYAPSAAGQGRALRDAYRQAGFSPSTVGLIEAHGTGTRVGDATELAALNEVYRETGATGPWCALGSVKSQIGHTKAAAGAAGLIKAALALHHKVLPPTIKVTEPLDGVGRDGSPFYVNTEPRPWIPAGDHPRRAGVSAFGFGGSNYHCVLEEADPVGAGIDWVGAPLPIAFSGESRQTLLDALDAWPTGLSWDELRVASARSRTRFRSDDPRRLVLVADPSTDLDALFRDAKTALASSVHENGDGHGNGTATRIPKSRNGVFLGTGAAPGGLALIFPGQGSQYVGMLRDLACRFPEVRQALAESDALHAGDGLRLSDQIYPLSSFTEAERAANESALRATETAQPAIGALSLGLCRVLDRFGIRPDVVAGHSYGELTALCASGRLDPASFARLSRDRGNLMAAEAARGGGAMLAVLGPLGVVQEVLEAEALDRSLVVANKNGPRQFVISGPAPAVARAAAAFEARGVVTRPLAVSAAFHSPEVAGAGAPFLESLRRVDLRPSAIPVYANTTAAAYPADPDAARALLAGQLAHPVEFAAMIEAMADAGTATFLEVGPDSRLTGLVRSILDQPGRPANALAIDASRGTRGNLFDLASALAELAALGYPVELARWDDGAREAAAPPRKPGLTVKICGSNLPPAPASQPSKSTDAPKPPQPDRHVATTPPSTTVERVVAVKGPSKTPVTPPTPTPIPTSTPTARPHMSKTPRQTQDDPSPPHPIDSLGDRRGGLGNGQSHGNGRHTPTTPPWPADLAPIPIAGADPAIIAEAMAHAQRGLLALQKLGEQTADLHRQFLDGQDRAHRTFQSLLEQQQRLTLLTRGVAEPARPPLPASRPAPIRETPAPARVPTPAPTPAPARVSVPSPELAPPPAPVPRIQPVAPPAPAAEPPPSLPGLDAGLFVALREVVSEKTGYPVEMLEPGMQLDADLGIDSIKRVEILSALQDRLPGSPVVKPEHLGTLRTLGDVAAFLGGGDREVTRATPPVEIATTPVKRESVQRFVLGHAPARESESTARRAPLSSGEFWVLDDGAGLSSALSERLIAEGFRARVVGTGEPAPDALNGLIVIAPPAGRGGDAFVKDAFHLIRAAGPALRRANGVLATVCRIDGAFGTREPSANFEPAFGGLAGLLKTARHEWPEVSCKAIDLDPALGLSAEAATTLRDEVLRQGPLEVGLSRSDRVVLELRREPIVPSNANDRGSEDPIGRGDLVVVTGGARGVTAEVAMALAEAFQPTLALFGRSPAPVPEPDWLAPLHAEAEIKRVLATRANGQATPQIIGEQYRAVTASREIAATLDRLRVSGASAHYRQVDVRDPQALRSAIDRVRAEHGPIRGLVHGAGVLADRRIEDLTSDQFNAVYDTKIAGLRPLLDAIGPEELRILALFSSSTARFGRTGQMAYAAANEVLNKLAQREAVRRPSCRVVAMNWGPWDGGMVTPSLKKVFASEGIGLIPTREGAQALVDELRLPPRSGGRAPAEVVILGGEGVPEGLSPAVESLPSTIIAAPPAEPLPSLTVVFERPLDLESIPVLRDHVIDGRGVLPMALTLEWLAQGAIQRNPGLALVGLDGLRLLKGAVLHDDRPETLEILVGKAAKEGSLYRVPVELRGVTASGKTVPHARGEVVLGDRLVPGDRLVKPPASPSYQRSHRSIYHDVLFHGPSLQGIERIDGLSESGIDAVV
ncbi:MAG: SDR family NAD(P)-dependent oxidoreductase, partial [Isosphaeraceae bacterium]